MLWEISGLSRCSKRSAKLVIDSFSFVQNNLRKIEVPKTNDFRTKRQGNIAGLYLKSNRCVGQFRSGTTNLHVPVICRGANIPDIQPYWQRRATRLTSCLSLADIAPDSECVGGVGKR